MNLIKTGAVMLTAFSVFAMTSCNKAKKELSIEKALEWVEEHYKEVKERTVETTTVKWDYSKNASNGNKTPEAWGGFKGMDINDFTAVGLNMMFDVKEEDAKKLTGETTIEGGGVLSDHWVNNSWVKENFEQRFDEGDLKIYTSGDKLEVQRLAKMVGIPTSEAYIIVIEADITDIYYFDNVGFVENYKYKMASDVGRCYLTDKKGEKVDGSEVELGKLLLNATSTPKDIK